MIELNKKAKPFHPCESLLGADLLYMCKAAQFVGGAYYNEHYPPDKPKDILMLLKGGHITPCFTKMKKEGWVDAMKAGKCVNELMAYNQLVHKDTGHRAFITTSPDMYDSFANAAEVIKLIGGPPSKEIVAHIHEIIMFNVKVKLGNDGTYTMINGQPHGIDVEPDNWIPPEPAPVTWAAQEAPINIPAGAHFQFQAPITNPVGLVTATQILQGVQADWLTPWAGIAPQGNNNG